MEERDCELACLLDEKELLEVCQNLDIDDLLTPMKNNRKDYEKQIKVLKKLDKSSRVVQNMLPNMAALQYNKGDENYKNVINESLKNFFEEFNVFVKNSKKPNLTIEKLREYSAKEVAKFYHDEVRLCFHNITLDMFFVLLKLCGLTVEFNQREIIKVEIEAIERLQELEKKYEKEKQNEIKRVEKRFALQFEQQEKRWKQKKKEVEQSLDDANEKIAILEEKLQLFAKKELKEFCLEYETQMQRKKEEAEKRFEDAIFELKMSHEQSKNYLDEELRDYRQNCEKRKEEIATETEKLVKLKKELQCEVDELVKLQKQEKENVERVEEYIKNYFNDFEKHIVEKKIEYVLENSLEMFEGEKQELKKEVVPNNIMPMTTLDNQIIWESAKAISKDKEYSQDVKDLEDFVLDLADNIDLYFDYEDEIATVIVSAFLNKNHIIVEESVGDKIAYCLSALVDLSTPLIIDVGTGKYSVLSLIKTIEESDSQVIYIVGLLSNFDEVAFSSISRKLEDRFIFYGIASVENLNLMTKKVLNKAIVLDIEENMHFPEDASILIGEHNLFDLGIHFDESICKKYYDKYFKLLCSEKLMGQKRALDFSVMLQTYFSVRMEKQLGAVFQKTIRHACNCSCNDTEKLTDVFTKSGITI